MFNEGFRVLEHGLPHCLYSIWGFEDAQWWKFDQDNGRAAVDSVSGINDAISGNFDYVAGASGKAIKFDGYTTCVTREAEKAPQLVQSFTIEAWIAPQTYPWNWTAIVNQGAERVLKGGEEASVGGDLKPGLFGVKYGDPKLSRVQGLEVLDKVEHDWTGGANDWSARWRGYIKGPFTGEVTFTAEADNGLKLEIGGRVVINGWGRDKPRSGKISMVAGKYYPVVLSYYQDGDPSFLRLYWSWAGQKKTIVNSSVLRYSKRDEAQVRKEAKYEQEEKKLSPRVFFGVDGWGHLGMKLMIDGKQRECVSDVKLPLLKWSHIAGTFDKNQGIKLYINGKEVGSLAVKGVVTPAKGDDLLIGKSHQKMSPIKTERDASRGILSNMIFDGLIDEVKIYDEAFSAEEVGSHYASVKPKSLQPLHWRAMPIGPKDLPPYFGAIYCRLNYTPEWEKLWRVGPYPDILIHFDESPVRMMFWHGTAYGAVWVSENGRLMGDQSLERAGAGKSKWGCSEHMSDKQCRYSRVRLIEDNDARKVVHWRYAIADIMYEIFGTDPVTGWGEWADEYYYIYPDAVSTRYQILYSNHLSHEWQETIVLNQPGTRPEDNVEINALTLGNMDGESHTYSWEQRPKRGDIEPSNPTIQITNLKSKNRPFIIFQPPSKIKLFTGCIEERSHFPWWNHWPVAQLRNDGRRAVAPDRPSHSSLSQSIEDSPIIKHDKEKGTFSVVTLTGMTEKSIKGLVPLARSWNYPAELKVVGGSFSSEGYDRYQRAYVLSCKDNGGGRALEFELAASESSPVVNPAFVVKDWGKRDAKLVINGKEVERSKKFRVGHRRRLEGTDLVVWVEIESTKPIKVILKPAG